MTSHITEAITKILIKKGDSKAIKWQKGMNAKFYYTCHAWIPDVDKSDKADKSHSCNCSIKDKHDLLSNILNPEKATASTKHDHQHHKDSKKPPKRTLIADSKKNQEGPFELRIGLGFQTKAMEICVKTMQIGEKSRFLCISEADTDGFLKLEQVMRQEKLNNDLKKAGKPLLVTSGCAMHMSPEALEITEGLEDAIGSPLEFEFELVAVENAGEYKREHWEVSFSEKFLSVPTLNEEGKQFFIISDYKNALLKYHEALEYLESLESGIQLEKFTQAGAAEKVKEWTIQARLNYALCQAKLSDFKSCIIQCTRVLQMDPKNQKALYRRASAYMAIGRDLDLAEKDLESLQSLNSQDAQMLKKKLIELLKAQKRQEKEMFSGFLLK